MGNYKSFINPLIHQGTLAAWDEPIPPEAKMKYLTCNTSLVTTALSAHDTETNANYKVPAGKQFWVTGLWISFASAINVCTLILAQSGTVDSAGTTRFTYVRMYGETIAYIPLTIHAKIDIAKYCTLTASTAFIQYVKIVGYELNAVS